ncbi:MAG TPA: tetratricopeptide repeat protein, partial [Pyrinomonadaceae bacterium]|nr:tetratricopeptide repeat protein [Pyrinomonadaceae bacterium]
LKRYEPAAADLQRAYDLQRAAKEDDANTVDALGQAYARLEKFEQALPLLVAATTRKPAAGAANAQPDPLMVYYRGLAEYRTGKQAEAESSFNQVVKLDPKNSVALFYLGRIAYERNDLDASISGLNRATLNDSGMTSAWALLLNAYLRRAAAATVPAKADADYVSAVRAGEGLLRVANDETAAAMLGQALVGAKQFARATTVLERFAVGDKVQGSTLYLLGVSYSRIKNFPKAVGALERAREKTPQDVNIYRELGYAYEVSKQYAKALAVYEKALELAPDDADFKESAERVRPVAK